MSIDAKADPAWHDILHHRRLANIETATEPVYAMPADYPAGYFVEPHSHSRAQLLYARTGIVMVTSVHARWMVPPEHALWIAPEIEHSVEMMGNVSMLSVFVNSDYLTRPAKSVRVVAVTPLARELIIAAMLPSHGGEASHRIDLVMPLLLDVVSKLPERELGLPFPADTKLASLCRKFLSDPSPHLVIDDWADELSMSRRAFTRAFRRETGLSLSTWRQQACLFAALPRLAGGEPITSVALDLGYESIAAFTTMFKRMLGAPPRAYFGATG